MVFQFQLARFRTLAFNRFNSRSLASTAICNMSLHSAISKLRSPVRDLVLAVTRDGQELSGQNEADEKEVVGWIEKTSQGKLVNENNLNVRLYSISLSSLVGRQFVITGSRYFASAEDIYCHKLPHCS